MNTNNAEVLPGLATKCYPPMIIQRMSELPAGWQYACASPLKSGGYIVNAWIGFDGTVHTLRPEYGIDPQYLAACHAATEGKDAPHAGDSPVAA